MLTAHDVWFRYRRRDPWVLADVGLRLAPGEVVGLVGDSGTGKTTLARLLAGHLRPHRGAVTIDGPDLTRRGARTVQLVLQHPELAVDPRWKVREILAEAGPVDRALLDELSIADGWLDRYPHELSGGELQRITVARALAAGATYVIADEITAMLDPLTQAQVWHVLCDRAGHGRIGILAISHDRRLLDALADRIVTLSGAPPRAPA